MKDMYKKTKGITLIALVVTIVVLLILATVTINMTMNSNGIFGRAKNAADTYKKAAANETAALNDISTQIDASVSETPKTETTVANFKGGEIISSTDNTALKDENGNTVTIPAGFKIASDSATAQEDGIVIEDKDGNQYVWIPVSDIANYKRTDYGHQSVNYSDYSEEMPVDEQTSVNTYHGYYIGRYEAGDKEYTANKVIKTSQVTTDTVTIKKGQAPYNCVTRDQANTLATGMKTTEGYKATTKLCSSYAWDTAIKFIQNTVANYGTTSPQGNYNNTEFTYTDITGATQTKASGSYVLIPTGETTPVCNIYDMGGNEYEWTTEAYSVSGVACVHCGGFYGDYYSSYPAGYRNYYTTTGYVVGIGFRTTLYM